jgi:leader peptidase (prepilin peptidase)/N-methyltransferase
MMQAMLEFAARLRGRNIVPTSIRRYEKGLAAAAAVAIVIASFAVAPDLRGALGAALGLLMLAIAVIDGRRFIIPNTLTAAALALGLVHAAVAAPFSVAEAIAFAVLRGAVVALVFFGLAAIYQRLRGRAGLGLGDVKLAGVAGIWLDWLTLALVVEFAALAAIAFYVLRNLVRRRALRTGARLPFGLFLAPAIWLGWLFEAVLM